MSATRQVVVRNRSGLHARPAARFVEQARAYDADISAELDGRTANAKSLIAVLKLGVSTGAAIDLHASGPDEDAALDRLVRLIDELADEEAAGGRA